MNKLISVIMPCYNAEKYIAEAIQSVQNQSLKDWELLIVDDSSTDNSANIAEKFAKEDDRIQLIKQPNSGACRARNNGIEHAKGEYIKFLDADDVLFNDCLENQIRQIQTLNPNQLPFGTYGRIDERSNRISYFQFSESMLELLAVDPIAFMYFHWEILISCPLHRIENLLQIGLFDTRLPRHQESDLHFRLALAGIQFVYFPIHTFDYREYHATSRISTRFQMGEIDIRSLNKWYYQKNEALLLEHYGEMPQIYRPTFADFWYGQARDNFANKDKANGLYCMKRSQSYMSLKGTRKLYYYIGQIVGYIWVETILRWRLKLLHKI